jgi:hypothetical protein
MWLKSLPPPVIKATLDTVMMICCTEKPNRNDSSFSKDRSLPLDDWYISKVGVESVSQKAKNKVFCVTLESALIVTP